MVMNQWSKMMVRYLGVDHEIQRGLLSLIHQVQMEMNHTEMKIAIRFQILEMAKVLGPC